MTTTPAAAAPSLAVARPADSWSLRVNVRADPAGPVLTTETVTEDDLADMRSELHLKAFLRAGRPDVPFEDVKARVVPAFDKQGANGVGGYELETVGPDGKLVSVLFTTMSLNPVALRAVRKLLAAGVIDEQATPRYEVVAFRGDGAASVSPMGPLPEQEVGLVGFTMTAKPKPLEYLKRPIAPLLEKAKAVGTVDPAADYPAFYTAEAKRKAELFARRGEKLKEPVETGAILIGPLCSCPQTGEFFSVVTTVVEIRAPEKQSQFSLSLSGESWDRIQTLVRQMRSQPATRAWRILGQAHGHPFAPDKSVPPCDKCPGALRCGRHTASVSSEDIAWQRAVFPQEPYQLAHIFGRDVLDRPVDTLFGLRDGTLLERGFYLIDEFRHS